MAAQHGAVPAVLAAITAKESERRSLANELVPANAALPLGRKVAEIRREHFQQWLREPAPPAAETFLTLEEIRQQFNWKDDADWDRAQAFGFPRWSQRTLNRNTRAWVFQYRATEVDAWAQTLKSLARGISLASGCEPATRRPGIGVDEPQKAGGWLRVREAPQGTRRATLRRSSGSGSTSRSEFVQVNRTQAWVRHTGHAGYGLLASFPMLLVAT